MSAGIFKQAKGADVASVAGAITLGDDGNVFDITGTNAITSITAKTAGTVVRLQFDSTASLVDGSNLKIAGNFQGAAESTITLYCDGTNWFELSRSPVASAASQSDQETATSTTTFVSPGRQQFHPSACKAWCSFNGTGTPAMLGTPYNIDATITDGGDGIFSLTFTNDLSSANFCVVISCKETNNAGTIGMVTAKATTGITIQVRQSDNNALVDPAWVDVAVFGDI